MSMLEVRLVGGWKAGQRGPGLELVHHVHDRPQQVGEAVVLHEIGVLEQAEDEVPLLEHV